jgi:predicted metal-dependent peptidase
MHTITLSGLTNERKYVKGQTIFNKSDINSPFVISIVKYVAKATGLPVAQLKAAVEERIAKTTELVNIAPNMYTSIAQNAAEFAAFELFSDNKVNVPEAPVLSGIILNKLFEAVQVENKQFWPLRDFVKLKTLRGFPNLVLIPSPSFPEYSNCKTACITPKADIFINKDFAQSLLNYAYLKGIKPKKKKYVCNGGDIPNEYAYLEFIIMHELLHYSYGDFYFDDILKASDDIINYAGDYRSNYKLVASGYEQLPTGLYSDTLNYDYHESYADIVKVVTDEMKKLQDNNKQNTNGPSDEHIKGDGKVREGNGPEGEPSKGGGGKGDPSKEKTGKGGEEAVDGQGEPAKDSEGGEAGKNAGSSGSTSRTGKSVGDIDKRAKEVDKEMDKSTDLGKSDLDAARKEQADSKVDADSGKYDDTKFTPNVLDLSNVKPRFNWKRLLRRAVAKAEDDVEETYAKIHRASITRIKQAVDLGEAATKPGERTKEVFKFALVIDSSGSMHDIIKQIYAEFKKLIKSTDLSGECFLYKFSDIFDLFVVNTRTGIAYDIPLSTRKKGAKVSLDESLYYMGCGTNFSDKLRKELEDRIDEGYNILLASDSDILWSTNKTNLRKLIKKSKTNVFVILDSRSTFEQMIKDINIVPANVSYWEK